MWSHDGWRFAMVICQRRCKKPIEAVGKLAPPLVAVSYYRKGKMYIISLIIGMLEACNTVPAEVSLTLARK
jgi:hypothetical protein